MKTILIVDDEVILADNEARMLESHGYNTITAYSAEEAIEKVEKEKIDLILMDIDYGYDKMDGPTAANIISSQYDIPIVFLSAHTDSDIVKRAEQTTSYGYIVKRTMDSEMVLHTNIEMAFRLHDVHKGNTIKPNVIQQYTKRKQKPIIGDYETKTKEELIEIIKEKDFLMKEFNHRVKNNLLLISSFIHETNETNISDLIYKINTIRILHEQFFQISGYMSINIKDYTQCLLNTIFGSFTNYEVEIVNTMDDVVLFSNTIIPLGLIINEVAINAIKYGFNDNSSKFIIDLKQKNDDYILTLSNTGNPMDNSKKSFGFELLTKLTKQLRGYFTIKTEPMTTVSIIFPVT